MNALFDATIVQNQRVKISPRLTIVTFVHIDFVASVHHRVDAKVHLKFAAEVPHHVPSC